MHGIRFKSSDRPFGKQVLRLIPPHSGTRHLARLVRIFLPRRRVLRYPLGRVVLRNKALDNFRFAIGP